MRWFRGRSNKSAKELKGKTLGVQAYGATDHVSAMMMFKHLGVDAERDIKVVALGSAAARLSALKEGVVEVAVMSPPADEEGRKLGFNILARAYELFSFPFVGLGTNTRKLKEKPDEVKRTIKALIKANRFIRQNRESTIQTLVDWGRTTPAWRRPPRIPLLKVTISTATFPTRVCSRSSIKQSGKLS